MKPEIRRAIPFRIPAWIMGGVVLVTLLMVARELNNTQQKNLYASYQGCSENYDESLRLCWDGGGKVVDLYQNGGLVIHKDFSGVEPKSPSKTAKR